MHKQKVNHNAHLRIEQTYPKHADYVKHLYDIYLNLTISEPKIVHRKPDKRTGKVYSTLRFRTRSLPLLNYYFDLFYKMNNNGTYTKVIPKDIATILSARSLAYWIIDDGHRTTYNQTVLNTNSFTLDEIYLLQEALLLNFKLRTRITEKQLGQYLIHIPVRQTVELRYIVDPYMIESIKYKVKSIL